MASTGDGFRATVGVIMAIVFCVIVVPTALMMIFCGGCMALVGTGAHQVQEAEKRATERRASSPVDSRPAEIAPANKEPSPKQEAPSEQANPEEKPAMEPKPIKQDPQPEAKPVTPEPETPDIPSLDEATATRLLDQAKALRDKSPQAAQRRLKEIKAKYPGTEAAKEAATLLGE